MRRLAIITVFALSGCATAYQSSGFTGGFEETALAPNIYRVSFAGNGYTSAGRAEELALLRSADLTLQKGFRYFALASANNAHDISVATTPRTTTTTANVQAVGNSAYGTAHSTSSGGYTYFVTKPSSTNIVVMFAEKPDVNGMVFDASFVCTSMGTKYKVTCGTK